MAAATLGSMLLTQYINYQDGKEQEWFDQCNDIQAMACQSLETIQQRLFTKPKPKKPTTTKINKDQSKSDGEEANALKIAGNVQATVAAIDLLSKTILSSGRKVRERRRALKLLAYLGANSWIDDWEEE